MLKKNKNKFKWHKKHNKRNKWERRERPLSLSANDSISTEAIREVNLQMEN
jgi:hypothetical protein